MNQVGNLKPKFIKAREEDNIENFMIDTIMTSEIIKKDTDQIVETEEMSTGKIEVDLHINKIIGEKILEVMQAHTKILGDSTVEENTEITIGLKITVEIEIGVDLAKDPFQEMLIIEETIEVIVDQGLVQEQVQIEIELGVINVENMIILQKNRLDMYTKG